MKISVFTCVLNPDFWCFPYLEAIKSYLELADEVIIVDGGSNDGSLEKIHKIFDNDNPKTRCWVFDEGGGEHFGASMDYMEAVEKNIKHINIIRLHWPWDFKQREFPLHLNYGLDNCTGDWVIKFDIDFVLHDFDAIAIKRKLKEHNDNTRVMVATFSRLNLLNRWQGFTKNELPWIIHKKFTKNSVRFGVEIGDKQSDWSQTIKVKEIKNGIPYGEKFIIDTNFCEVKDILRLGNRVFNYDSIFRDKIKCEAWFCRAARAYRLETGKPIYGKTDKDAWELWKEIRMQYKVKRKENLKIGDHPIFIQDKIKNMTPDMWGYNNWDWKL